MTFTPRCLPRSIVRPRSSDGPSLAVTANDVSGLPSRALAGSPLSTALEYGSYSAAASPGSEIACGAAGVVFFGAVFVEEGALAAGAGAGVAVGAGAAGLAAAAGGVAGGGAGGGGGGGGAGGRGGRGGGGGGGGGGARPRGPPPPPRGGRAA